MVELVALLDVVEAQNHFSSSSVDEIEAQLVSGLDSFDGWVSHDCYCYYVLVQVLRFDCYYCENRFSSLFFVVVRLDDHRHVGRLLRCKPLLMQ